MYISQLIRYARCCSHYDDFRYRHKCLVDRLLSQGYRALSLEKSFKKFDGRYQDLIEKYQRSVNVMVNDSFPGSFLFNMQQDFRLLCYLHGFVAWICLNLDWLLAVTGGVMHEADDAYSIRSTWSCYWLDQFLTLALNTLILSIFYISLDLSTIYFAHFSGCWASFVCSCHSIPECCVMFSGVKLSMGSFVLLLLSEHISYSFVILSL